MPKVVSWAWVGVAAAGAESNCWIFCFLLYAGPFSQVNKEQSGFFYSVLKRENGTGWGVGGKEMPRSTPPRVMATVVGWIVSPKQRPTPNPGHL